MKKAFSLIELLIVIVIIGVVYTLSVGNFKKLSSNDEKTFSLLSLKQYLQEMSYTKSAKILCLDDCSSCDIFLDDEKFNEEPIEGFLDKKVNIYRYNFLTGVDEVEKKIYFNSEGVEENICFSYSVDKRGVGDQVIVEFKDKIYDFSTYLGSIPVYDSLEELVDAKEKLSNEVLR